MKKKLNIVLILSICSISSSIVLADKPEWAGNGGKPSKYEKREHVEEMTSKHKYKKHKKEKYERDDEYHERDHERYERDDDHHDHDHERYERDDDYHRYEKESRYSNNGEYYEGKGMSDSEFIDQKKDETKKNWIGKFFDFLN